MSSALKPEPIAIVGGQRVNIIDAGDAINRVAAFLRAGEGFTFATLNLDHLVKLRVNAAFRLAYERMSLICADGAPIAALARETAPSVRRTTGADLLRPLCELAAREHISVAFFGSSPEVLALAAARLRDSIPGLEIALLESPPNGFDPASPAADAYGARIAASGAKLALVCLGAPKQEIFADRMAQAHRGIGFVGVGASADFIAGAQIRAPVWTQQLGLEWLWRLATNPRRLGWRYLQCAALLAQLWLEKRAARPVGE